MRKFVKGVTSLALVAVLIAAPSARAQVLPTWCFADGDCDGGAHCIEGTCRGSCTSDGDCGGGACVAGGCFAFVPVEYPNDYGLSGGNSEPGCDSNDQCSAQLHCVAGKCQNGEACTDQNEPHSEFCAPIGGYSCADNGQCEAGTCSGDSDCTDAYPIAGLACLNGRCSSRCTRDSDCCDATAGIRCPAGRPQGHCFVSPGDPQGGLCVASVDTGRMIIFQEVDPDPRKVADNIVFVFEGITAFSGSDFSNYEHRALRHIRWLVTKASVHNALMRNFNIYILELRDRTSGEGLPTLFGHFFGPDQLQEDLPGSEPQARFAANNAISQVAAAHGVTGAQFGTFKLATINMYPAGGGFSRAFSGSVVSFPSDSGDLPDFHVPPSPAEDPYYVLQHELGHFLSDNRVRDEYDNDAASAAGRNPRDCDFNIASRHRITGCTTCDGSDDGPFTPTSVDWGPFINTSSFPTTADDFGVCGLYEGADLGFTQASMRSQIDCVMRQNDGRGDGRTDFCPACREGLIKKIVPTSHSQLVGLLELDGHIESPVPAGNGPHLALAVSSARHEAYLTRDTEMGPVVTVIDGNLIDIRGGSTDVALQPQLGTAGVPRAIAIDEAHEVVYLEAADPLNPTGSALLLLDPRTRMLLPAVEIPYLVGLPLVEPNAQDGGQVITYAEPAPTFAGQMVTFPLGQSPAFPVLSVPTAGGVLPRFGRAGLRAPVAGLDFFVADERVPADPFCGFGSCQIWAFDPATLAFRDGSAITVPTGMPVNDGIQLAIVVNVPTAGHSLNGELLIAVTEASVLVWRTSDVASGNTAPAATWPHNLGAGGKLLSAVNYVAALDTVILGNKDGQIALFSLSNGAPGPAGDAIALPLATPTMEVRDLVVGAGGAVFVGLGGFAPPIGTPRTGLLATLDLSGNMLGANRVVFQQIVDAVGLGGPVLAIDTDRDIVYTNAVINSGDHIGGDPAVFRAPILRGFTEPIAPPAGCP